MSGRAWRAFFANPEQGTVLQELTSVNLRIAREKTVPLPQELTAALRGHFIGMLLVGEPGSGQDHIAAQYCPGARPAAEDPFGH